MKKFFYFLLVIVLVVVFSSCSSSQNKEIAIEKETSSLQQEKASSWEISSNQNALEFYQWEKPSLQIENYKDGETISFEKCSETILPEIKLHFPSTKRTFWAIVFRVRNQHGWTYLGWLPFNLPFWDYTLNRWQDEFPNETLLWINSSGKKKFHSLCPPKWETYEYDYTFYIYPDLLRWSDDSQRREDYVNRFARVALTFGKTHYFITHK